MLHAFSRMIVGLDQALNPIVYGGSEDVTISSQSAYREIVQHKSAWPRKAIDWVFRVFFRQKDHCFRSLLLEAYQFRKEEQLILALLDERGIRQQR